MPLEWPDSELLLQNIISTDWSLLALPPQPVPGSHDNPDRAPSLAFDATAGSSATYPMTASQEAIQELRNMITSLVCCCTHDLTVYLVLLLTPIDYECHIRCGFFDSAHIRIFG